LTYGCLRGWGGLGGLGSLLLFFFPPGGSFSLQGFSSLERFFVIPGFYFGLETGEGNFGRWAGGEETRAVLPFDSLHPLDSGIFEWLLIFMFRLFDLIYPG